MDHRDNPIVFVACCGQKLSVAAPAEDMYQSDLFKKSRAWAEIYGVSWFILSAKYGVVPPGRRIKPYDETLNSKTPSEVAMWNKMVRSQLGYMGWRRSTVVLAGANYRGWIQQGDNVIIPMKGMGIGQQKAWLKQQIQLGTQGVACE